MSRAIKLFYLRCVEDTIFQIKRLVVAYFVPVAPVHGGQCVSNDVSREKDPGLELTRLLAQLRPGHVACVHVRGGHQGLRHPGQAPRHHQCCVRDDEVELVARQVRVW